MSTPTTDPDRTSARYKEAVSLGLVTSPEEFARLEGLTEALANSIGMPVSRCRDNIMAALAVEVSGGSCLLDMSLITSPSHAEVLAQEIEDDERQRRTLTAACRVAGVGYLPATAADLIGVLARAAASASSSSASARSCSEVLIHPTR